VKVSRDIYVYCNASPKPEAADVDEAEPIESDIRSSGVDRQSRMKDMADSRTSGKGKSETEKSYKGVDDRK
jgi:hypothetical protein